MEIKYIQSREDIREEIKIISDALGQPEINLRETAKYRWHMEDAVSKLQVYYNNTFKKIKTFR